MKMALIAVKPFLSTKIFSWNNPNLINFSSVVLKKVTRFAIDPTKSSYQYFDLLDRDGDGLLSFQEFLGPFISIMPADVAMVFTSDIRFKIESLNYIRIAFTYCMKLSQAVTPDLVRTKLAEKNDEIGKWHLAEFELMELDERVFSTEEWQSNFCKHEKYIFDSFT